MHDPREVAVYLGLDVGKGEHHAVGLSPAGKKVHDRALPNSEPKLRALFDKLATKHGKVLVIVDQPASIGALPLTVARDAGCLVAYLPGLSMRRVADLYPGEAKTDARDAYIIADAARTMPHLLRDLKADDETIAALSMILGFDDDLAGESTRAANRIRGLLTSIHPGLERVLGPRLQHPAVLDLLARHGAPGEIQAAGIEQITAELRENAPRMARRLPRRSSTPWPSRPSWFPAPMPRRSSFPDSPPVSDPHSTSANVWRPRSRPCWRPTLFPRS